jgi:hypothetical protein
MKRNRKKPGPKRNAAVVKSFAAAAAKLGHSVEFLKSVRDVGAAGFHLDGRIDTKAAHAWMMANPDKIPKTIGWKSDLGLEKLRAEKRRNDQAEGLLIEKAKVAELFQRIFRPALAKIEQMLVNEYPSKVSGLDVPAARVYGKRILDLIIEAHREAAMEWK